MLVAHHDPALPGRVREWLAPFGGEVDGVMGLEAARSAISAMRYDVVVADRALCPADPARLVADIKRGVKNFRAAVIVVASELPFDEAMADLGRGAHDFIKEPIDPAEMVARVRGAFRVASLQAELIESSTRLELLVYKDALTGLNNRRFMLTQLSALISGARRHGRPITVVMIDIDRFKLLNDTYGHAVGDRALIAVAAALRERLRAEDYIGRLGGEEFLAILPDTGEADGEAVAEGLRGRASDVEVITPEGQPVSVTVSVGWATWEGEPEPAEALIRRADRALYAAKEAGRDLVRRG